MATVIAGTLKANIASPDWHGHRVQALFSEQLELAPATAGSGATATATSTATWIPAVRSAEVGQDGTFKLELPDKTKMQGPVALEVLGPSGAVLGYHSYSVDALSAALELNANPQPAFLITPSDPNAGRTPKLAGRVVDKAARHKASNLQVVLYGAPKPPTPTAPQLPPRPLLVAKTDANGYFFGDYPQGKFNQAYGIVGIGSGQKAPISLTGDAFPREVILVVDVPAPAAHDDCTCHDDVPRAPSPQDLVNSPETYSTDLGGGKCVSITVPNRALEEFSFYRLVRTTEPEIKGLHLPKPRPIPAGILNVLLQMTTGAGSASRGMLRPNGGAAVDPSAQAAGRSQPMAASSELPNPGGAAEPAGSASEGELPAWAAGGNWDTAGGSPGVSVVTNPGPPTMERGTEAIGAGRLAQPGSGFAPASTTTATVSRMSLDGGVRWRWLAASAGAGLLVTHLISALILAVFVALTLVARAAVGRLSRAGLRRLALTAAGTAGLAAFWLVPMVAHRDLHGVLTSWGTPPLPTRLADIATGRVLFPAGLAALVLAGWLYQVGRALRHRHRRDTLVWVLVPAAYLPVVYGILRLFGPGDVTLQLPNRGLGYAGLPHQADPATQDQAAQRLLARSGWGQWPGCSRAIGAR